MTLLRIEHPVPSFDKWKQVFDSDPAQRERSGVRRYAIARPADDPNYITVDLEFDTAHEAEVFLSRMRKLWSGSGGQVSSDQRALVLEVVESGEYPPR